MEEIFEHIDRLKEMIVIVEGKKDIRAMKNLGVKAIEIDGPLEIFAEEISRLARAQKKQVAILVDLDKEGRKIYSKLNHYLNQLGVSVNNDLRHYLFRKTKLRVIEGIDRYFGKIEKYND